MLDKNLNIAIKTSLRGLYAQPNDRHAVFMQFKFHGYFCSIWTIFFANNSGTPSLVVHSPRYDGSAVQVDGAGGVVPPVHGDHRYVARHLYNTAFSAALFTTFDWDAI